MTIKLLLKLLMARSRFSRVKGGERASLDLNQSSDNPPQLCHRSGSDYSLRPDVPAESRDD